MQSEHFYRFDTDRFSVVAYASPDYDPDLSWDEDGSVAADLNNGRLIAFSVRIAVYLDGNTIGTDSLGGCVYESLEQFRQEAGYFRDMVRSAIREARTTIRSVQQVKLRQAA